MVEKKIRAERYFCVIFAELSYFLVVSISAAYLSQRYMTPIYAVLFLTIFCLISGWMKKKTAAYYLYGMCFLTTIICVNGLKNTQWSNLKLSSEPLINVAGEHSAADCLFIYDREWHILPAYCEVSKYHSVTFLREEHLELLNSMDLPSRYELVVVVDGEDLELINRILDYCPYLNVYEHLGRYESTNSYYLYGE